MLNRTRGIAYAYGHAALQTGVTPLVAALVKQPVTNVTPAAAAAGYPFR